MEKQPVTRTASCLVKEYGLEAADLAAENLEWSLAHDDVGEVTFWREVMARIRQLELKTRVDGDIAGNNR